jgi:hypothetical protein
MYSMMFYDIFYSIHVHVMFYYVFEDVHVVYI